MYYILELHTWTRLRPSFSCCALAMYPYTLVSELNLWLSMCGSYDFVEQWQQQLREEQHNLGNKNGIFKKLRLVMYHWFFPLLHRFYIFRFISRCVYVLLSLQPPFFFLSFLCFSLLSKNKLLRVVCLHKSSSHSPSTSNSFSLDCTANGGRQAKCATQPSTNIVTITIELNYVIVWTFREAVNFAWE